MSKHTPGPWFCGQDGFNLGNGVVYARHSNGNPKDICHLHGWGGDKQADSKLIAAAPDLLEALEAAEAQMFNDLDRIEGEWGMGENIELIISRGEVPAITMARKAIARAKGESQ